MCLEINRDYWVVIKLLVLYMFSFKLFQSTPFESVFFQLQALFFGVIILFIFVYLMSYLHKNKLPDNIHLYFLLLAFVIPVYSALRANSEFGQPLLHGILSERQWLVVGVVVWLSYAISTAKLTQSVIEKSFVAMAWLTLIVFTLMTFLFDSSLLDSNEQILKMVEITEDRGTRFRFQTYFVTFGAIYYFVAYASHKRLTDFWLMMCFISYIAFVVQGRTYILAMALTFIVYLVLNYSLPRLAVIVLKLLLLSVIAVIVINYLAPDYIERMSYMFAQMTQALSGQLSEDDSVNARIFASVIVIEYFDTQPITLWFGTGRLSNQWNEGYSSLFGYFYPSDIGVLGGVFLYGVVGLVFLFVVPFFIVLNVLKNTSDKSVFIVSLKYLLIFTLVKSLQGSFYFGYVGYMVPLFVLLAHNKLRMKCGGLVVCNR